jgi:hypothetical protein
MFTITRDWIHQHKTARGAWTMAQTKAIGLDWPLRHGWMDRIAGTQISDEAKAAFESATSTFRPKTIRLMKLHEQAVFCPHCGGDISETPVSTQEAELERPCWSRA